MRCSDHDNALPISRRAFTFRSLGLFALGAVVPWGAWRNAGLSIEDEIRNIGNLEDDGKIYHALRKMIDARQMPDTVRKGLQDLLPYIDLWANGKLKINDLAEDNADKAYLTWVLRGCRLEHNVPPKIDSGSAVYPLWCMYRGRMLAAVAMEYGEIRGVEETLHAYLAEIVRLIREAGAHFQENRILKMYLGDQVSWQSTGHIRDNDAPSWAVYQRNALNALRNIIYWWIDNRQLPDGQYGGGWGDDVEMWRKWTPWLVALKDEKIAAAQRRLSAGLFGLEYMKGGYTSRMSDVEHTAEDSADTITAMMHLAPEDEVWNARAMHLARLMKTKWTGINERGFLQFKSTYFTAGEVDLTPRKACDTVYHPRAVQPALLLWQRTGDPFLAELFTAWLKTWVDASMRAEHGKPAGIIPSAIHWPDGKVGGLTDTWWKPGNYTENPLYVWPSSMGMMTNTLLLAYQMTGDPYYLKPIISMAGIRQQYLEDVPVENPDPGSRTWCAERMGSFLPMAIAKYRLLTGDTRFDTLLKEEKLPYLQWAFFGDEQVLTDGLKSCCDAFTHNWPMYTSEVRWTDRVFAFNSYYLKYIADRNVPLPDSNLLYSTITGDPGDPLYFPLNGFQWLGEEGRLAVRVRDHGTDHALIDLFLFGDGPLEVGMKPFMLRSGMYKVSLTSDRGVVQYAKDVFVEQNKTLLSLPLEARQPMVLMIGPV